MTAEDTDDPQAQDDRPSQENGETGTKKDARGSDMKDPRPGADDIDDAHMPSDYHEAVAERPVEVNLPETPDLSEDAADDQESAGGESSGSDGEGSDIEGAASPGGATTAGDDDPDEDEDEDSSDDTSDDAPDDEEDDEDDEDDEEE